MKRTNKKGFTLIELLVVIAILGLLVTITTVSVTRIRKDSKEKEVIALRQSIVAAFDNYRIDNNVNKNTLFAISNLRFTSDLSYSNSNCEVNENNTIKYIVEKDIDIESDSNEEIYCIKFICNGITAINDYENNSTFCIE